MNITKLNELELNLVKAKYPNNPYPVATVHKESSANALTQAVIRWIQIHKGQAERINTTGRYLPGKTIGVGMYGQRTLKGKYIPTTSTKGSADISATIRGRSVKIEIKYGKDVQSDAQKKYQQDVEASGGLYWLVRTFDGFVKLWEGIL
jgi:hypothetical protein